MVYLRRVVVEGLVGRDRPLDIKFQRDINVIWGLNGSGKTSLLRIINSALSNETASILNVPFRRALVEFYTEDLEIIVRREIVKEDDAPIFSEANVLRSELEAFASVEKLELYRRYNELHDQGKSESLEWKTEPDTIAGPMARFMRVYLPTTRLSTLSRRGGQSGRLDSLDVAFADEVTKLWATYNSRSLQTIDAIRERGIGSILAAILAQRKITARRKKAEVSPELAYDLVRQYLSSQKIVVNLGKRPEFLDRYEEDTALQEVVAEIVEVQDLIEAAREPQRTIEELLARFYSRDKRIAFNAESVEVRLGERVIPLIGLSSGERQVLYILLECLSARGSVVIVDEPELSMHVDWQHDLVAAMQAVAPKSQLIMATHSPEIMADIPTRKIFKI